MPELPSQAMATQANLIMGGLLLTTIIRTWANNTVAVTSGGAFATLDVQSTDRSVLMQGTQPKSMDDFPEYVPPPV
ncbi:hypothetical protein PG990_001634 [Apiospora arundinis]|uniref:Uncharacterized protein n=1 Tax=Apiospora arundinis TaxID=335852 RepID=A0ABR2HSF6_9PEZI